MLPEISRRCTSCGAAVRAGARFCPQCGQAVAVVGSFADEEPRGGEVASAGSQEGAPAFAPDVREGGAARATTAAGAGDVVKAGDYPGTGDHPGAGGVAHAGDFAGGVESVGAGARVAADDSRGRVARVREGARARVGRMRNDALVALEETPDDSGLRFVVVAAVLFALFLIFLFLSTTVLR